MSTQDKQQLRRRMLERRKLLTSEQRSNAERVLLDRLIMSDLWSKSLSIGCYLAMPNELSASTVIRAAIAANKDVSVPVITGPGKMKFVSYKYGDTCRRHPRYHLREPIQQDIDTSESLDMLIVPAVAIDRNHHRLGYGYGYYDRFLNQHKHLKQRTIGITFRCCDCESVMPESHDVEMAHVILA